MSRFVFVVPPFMGHINPTLSVGAELARRGHTVTWIAWHAVDAALLPPGARCVSLADDCARRESIEQALVTLRHASGINSNLLLYEQVLIPLARAMAPGVARALESLAPDLVIADQQAFAGSIAASKTCIPYATFVTAPAAIADSEEFANVTRWRVERMLALQAELGATSARELMCSDLLTLVFSTRELAGPNYPTHFHFVGPVLAHRRGPDDFPWTRLQALPRPRILVSLGTLFGEAAGTFFARVAAAFADPGYGVVVVAPRGVLDGVPAHFLIAQRIPQLEVLGHVDAVISHGGHNTVTETLAQGLPLVVLPIAVDQFHVASQVVSAGCGLRLHFKRSSAADLRRAVDSVLAESAFGAAARRVRASFEFAGGTPRVADQLIDVARNPAAALAS